MPATFEWRESANATIPSRTLIATHHRKMLTIQALRAGKASDGHHDCWIVYSVDLATLISRQSSASGGRQLSPRRVTTRCCDGTTYSFRWNPPSAASRTISLAIDSSRGHSIRTIDSAGRPKPGSRGSSKDRFRSRRQKLPPIQRASGVLPHSCTRGTIQYGK